MKQEALTLEAALQRGSALPWAFFRCYSEVYLGPNRVFPDASEILEARLFSETEEIRVFRTGNALVCASFVAEDGDESLISSYQIANRKAFGDKITVRRFIDYDEDGQAIPGEVHLCGWKGDV